MNDVITAMRAGKNIEFRGDLTLDASPELQNLTNLYLRNNVIFYVTGDLTTTGTYDIAGDGTLWVRGTYTDVSGDIDVPTQVGGTVTLGSKTTTIKEDLSIQSGDLDLRGQDLTISSNVEVYVGRNVKNTLGNNVTLTINGHLEAKNDANLPGDIVEVLNSNSLIVGRDLTAATLIIGSASPTIPGRVVVTGNVTAAVTMHGGSLTTAAVNGTITGADNGTITQTSSGGEATLTGTASGSFAGDVTITGTTTVTAKKTMTVDGNLAVTTSGGSNELTVAGTLVLNGSADLTNVKGAEGGVITFGRNFEVSGTYQNTTSKMFVDSNGVALTNDQLAGRTFEYDAAAGSATNGKFVSTSALAEDAEIRGVAFDSSMNVASDSDYNINMDAEVVTVEIQAETETVSLDVDTKDTLTVKTDANNAVTVSGTDITVTVATAGLTKVGDTYRFVVTVSSDGKNSVDYTFVIRVVADTDTPTTAGGDGQ